MMRTALLNGCVFLVTFWMSLVYAERFNYCPRSCIRGVQQFPFTEICICPEYCPLFCCAGYYYHSPIHGVCPSTCGMKSRPIHTECCLPGGFSDVNCIVAQKRWFDVNTRGVWWWPAVFNASSTPLSGQYARIQGTFENQRSGSINTRSFTTLALVKPENKHSTKVAISNSVTEPNRQKTE